MNNATRVPTQVHTRKLDRSVARSKMRKEGIRNINKDGGKGSFFSTFWRKYATDKKTK